MDTDQWHAGPVCPVSSTPTSAIPISWGTRTPPNPPAIDSSLCRVQPSSAAPAVSDVGAFAAGSKSHAAGRGKHTAVGLPVVGDGSDAIDHHSDMVLSGAGRYSDDQHHTEGKRRIGAQCERQMAVGHYKDGVLRHIIIYLV